MKKCLFIFLLAFSVLGISGCGGSSFSAKVETFNFVNAAEEAYTGDFPELTLTEREKQYPIDNDPCSAYTEKIQAVYTVTNNTKQYMVDTPVLISLLDAKGNPIPDMYSIGYVNMGPKSTTYFPIHATLNQLFDLEEPGDWESTGEKKDGLSVYSCQVNKDAPAHVKDASGLSIEVLSDKNTPDSLKSKLTKNVADDIDTYVSETYQDEPSTGSSLSGSSSRRMGQVVYNTYLSFEDVTADLNIGDDKPTIKGNIHYKMVNELGEAINTYGFELGAIFKEGKTILGGGFGLARVGYDGIAASDKPKPAYIDSISGELFKAPTDKNKVEVELFLPAVSIYPYTTEPIVKK